MPDATIAYPVSTIGSQQTQAGGVDWGAILGSLGTAGLDIYNLISGKPTQTASTAANLANPLIPAQPQALGQLQQFLTDPSSVLKDPAFVAAEQLGAENISRQAGAAGMASSGNRLADLFKFGQTSGLAYEQQRFNQLMDVLRPSPQAGQFYLGGQGAKQQSIADLVHQLLGGAGGAGSGLISQIIKGFSGGGGGGFDLSGLDMSGASGVAGDIGSVEIPGYDFGGGSDIIDFGAPFGP